MSLHYSTYSTCYIDATEFYKILLTAKKSDCFFILLIGNYS